MHPGLCRGMAASASLPVARLDNQLIAQGFRNPCGNPGPGKEGIPCRSNDKECLRIQHRPVAMNACMVMWKIRHRAECANRPLKFAAQIRVSVWAGTLCEIISQVIWSHNKERYVGRNMRRLVAPTVHSSTSRELGIRDLMAELYIQLNPWNQARLYRVFFSWFSIMNQRRRKWEEIHMSYAVFCNRVSELVNKLGLSVEFSQKDGRHFARVSDGTRIVGNSTSSRVEIRWGSGHKAIAAI